MSNFSQGFNFGFLHGMFNGMFGGMFGCGFGGGFYTPYQGFGFNFSCFTPPTLFMTPSYNFNAFSRYQSPNLSLNSTWNSVSPSFNNSYTSQITADISYNVPDFSQTFSFGDTFTKTINPQKDVSIDKKDKRKIDDDSNKTESINKPKKSPKTEKKYSSQVDGDFDKMLKFVLQSEGGYTSNDCGQAGNKGVQQSTYDEYRRKNGLSKRSVKNITDEEVRDLYYTMFYKASGADKIKDSRLALYVFDTAVNMGVSAAKKLLEQSGNDADKFEELRLKRYESIASANPSKAKYLKGWKNRVANAQNYANQTFMA